ncbi:MAG: lytic transglycosylase domain-containing protein [Candidatus Berkelbacteria bacterium]|nr:lytic transglycosylase domain-containing protein [Candidatus Berkelbacteria bacterium]
MTLQLGRGRSVKIKINKAALSLQERIKSYFHKLSVENTHYTKMASFAVIGTLIPLTVLPVNADQNMSEFKSNVVLTKNSQVIDVALKTPTIVPGESQDQIAVRVAAENAARAAQAAAAAKSVKTVVTTSRVYVDPSSFDGIYQSAGSAYGIDWRILKAVHYVETGCSGSTSKRNPSGATGPMQFIPSTWRHYGVDGNGDGVVDITNVNDAIYAAANYLSASGGAMNGYKTALWSYNPSTSYFNKVMNVARSLGF